ncbi:LLM class flavin-dependent oxidoreductase [Nocardia sp. alder85J]|uniref:LLM class flavin-dependent oxidoreductase n=1 Tax=Nocardia sp. alder85J TaxID=2862949 RepID=UPI001CD2AC77|nr:LLM class flavin-dependent oxidoreductase [Nocardia sp. alder85J]MCX4092239.1 LLM class flavin-dependent oxidoreductase [Nocardia sp. alder85J]
MASDSGARTYPFVVGIELDGEGYHPAAWRRAAHEPDRLLTGPTLRTRVTAVENAGFTFATFDDSILPPESGPAGRVDATTRATFVAATTSTLGLVPVAAATYAEPFHLSSQLATLDYASRGRAGWLVADDPAAARAWGAAPRSTADEIRRERVDSVEVARRLWDSWEDDAVVRDYASGRFLNRDRLHYIDFVGETFSVKGPAIVPRPPQGQVVVFGYEPGDVDVVVVRGATREATVAAADAARIAGATLVVADLEVALDTPSATAAQRLAELDGHESATDTGRLRFTGAAAELVALITELSGDLDGVRLHPAVVDEELPVLYRLVLPALSRAGLIQRPVPGSTLRANLGLSRPANRYAKEHSR